jgi:hypothetical protein
MSYQLGYAGMKNGAGAGIEPAFLVLDAAYETAVHPSAHPRMKSCGGGTRTRTLSHTRRALFLPFELRRKDSSGRG